jgi:hypothetical protein
VFEFLSSGTERREQRKDWKKYEQVKNNLDKN